MDEIIHHCTCKGTSQMKFTPMKPVILQQKQDDQKQPNFEENKTTLTLNNNIHFQNIV